MAIPPPITAEKKLLKINNDMFEMKWPNKLEGATINEYLKLVPIKFMLRLGSTFLIFRIFKSVINVIEIKNETVMLLIPINGVKIIKLTNKAIEPIM